MEDVVETLDNLYSLYSDVNKKAEKTNSIMLCWVAITAILTFVSTIAAVIALTVAVMK